MNELEKPVLLFDGVCNLCNGVVQFVIKRDPDAKFSFTSLQSNMGQRLLQKFQLPTSDFESFVLVEGDRYYRKSTAALRLFSKLGGGWRLLYVFMIVPVPIRDFFYSLVANNRYKIFGRTDECWIPTPELKARFLE
ncbi:thiol-disulfide oxidoreductase DCC family protein [Fulvivirgaceae bacterium BMA12]|uniref:Thiol-disulfide oxidoreductase DCC family protein n=1 Tax=Agaribacillus aureus TaxID=3051825 RepID=A0ABT8LEH6_9BACT|nr:thiol-disulfide oxidoreductase DCC family protein [Fulvivirgaceae bacterium BMA12]